MTRGNWRIARVEEVAAAERNSLVGGPFGSNLVSADYVAEGVPVIRGQNMGSGRWVAGEFAYVSSGKAERLSPNVARPGDIVFTQRGTLGQVAIVPAAPYERYVVSQSQMKLTVNRLIADPLFVYYVFASGEQRDYILRNAIQTGVPHTNLEILRNTPILLPPLQEQQAIAGILGSLDIKIELNRRTNETLESIARATFKSWFVDFDPVRAKAEGWRPAGMDAETAALFPATWFESRIGTVPTGWSVRPLSELCTTQYGYTASATEQAIGPKFLRVMDINKLDWIDWSSVPHCEIGEGDREKYALQAGDIVVARMADPGKAAIIENSVDAVFASYLVRLKANSVAAAYFIYGFLKSQAYQEYIGAVKSGSVQANMNARVITAAELVAPPAEVLAKYLNNVLPLRKRLTANVQESLTLATIRDALLPKLLSGELRIRDAEKMVEAHV